MSFGRTLRFFGLSSGGLVAAIPTTSSAKRTVTIRIFLCCIRNRNYWSPECKERQEYNDAIFDNILTMHFPGDPAKDPRVAGGPGFGLCDPRVRPMWNRGNEGSECTRAERRVRTRRGKGRSPDEVLGKGRIRAERRIGTRRSKGRSFDEVRGRSAAPGRRPHRRQCSAGRTRTDDR